MSFPGALTPRIDMYYAGVWNNITGDVLARDVENSIVIKRGRQDWDSSITPDTCDLKLKNADGRYSPRNAAGPLYGLIGRNTPIRVGLGAPCIAAAGTGANTASLVAPSVTAEQTGYLIGAWLAANTAHITLPAGFGSALEQNGTLTTFNSGYRTGITAGATGAQTATASGTAPAYAALDIHVPGASSVSALVLFSTLGNDVQFTSPTVAGNLVIAVVGWDDDTEDRMQPPKIQGDRGAGWYLIADSGVSPAAGVPRLAAWACRAVGVMGQISFVGKRDGIGDAYMRTFVITGAAAYLPRFTGEIPELPVEWDLRGKDVWTAVQAASITRRVGSSDSDSLRSAVYEAFTRRASNIAYWPLEDTTGAGSFTSGTDGGLPMSFAANSTTGFTTSPQLGQFSGFQGSDPVPTFNSAGGLGPLQPYADTGQLAFGCLVYIPAAGSVAGANLFALELTGGTISTALMEWTNATTWTLKVRYNNGAADEAHAVVAPALGSNAVAWLELKQVGANVTYRIAYATLPADNTNPVPLFLSGTLAGANTLGIATRMTLGVETGTGQTLHNNGVAFGHAFVTNSTTNVFNTGDPALGATSPKALQGWNGQKVSDRIYRLCADNGLKVNVPHQDIDEFLGVQLPATLMADLQAAEDASAGGQISGAMGFLGLQYRGRNTKLNNAPRITLDYNAKTISAPFIPTDDDQNTQNDVTVNRIGGSSGRAVLATGPLSVRAFPNGVGPYRQGYDLSLYSDAQAQPQAQWRMHLGTINEARWPSVTFDLGVPANAALITGAMPYLDLGDTVRLTNLPVWAGSDRAGLILEGYTENIGSYRWIFTGNYSPASGFRVAALDDTVYGRLDSANSYLDAPMTSGAVQAYVFDADGWGWSTTDVPYDVIVAGERMTVTAGGRGMSDNFNRTVANGWGVATPSGGTWTVTGTASDYSCDGANGVVTLTTVSTTRVTSYPVSLADVDMNTVLFPSAVALGNSIGAGLIARADGAFQNFYHARVIYGLSGVMLLQLNKVVAGVETGLASVPLPLAYGPGSLYQLRFQAIGPNFKVKIWSGTEPAFWQIDAITDTDVTAAGALGTRNFRVAGNTNTNPTISYDNIVLSNPQLLTVTRSINGVSKAQNAGAKFSLAEPVYIGL